MHRLGVVGAIAGLSTALAVGLGPRAQAAVPIIVVDGKGFGHGVGMSQDGAFWMGRAGASSPQILGQFYPGTSLGRTSQDSPLVRVGVFDAGAAPSGATVSFPEGGMILDALGGPQSPGFPVNVPAGESVRLAWDGTRYAVVGGTPSGQPRARAAAAAAPTDAAVPTTAPMTLLPPPPTVPPPPSAPPPPAPTTTTRPSPTTTAAAPSPSTGPASGGPGSGPGGGPGGGPSTSSTRPLWAVPTAGGRAGQGTTTVNARDRTYRGAVEAVAESGSLRLVDQVVVEDYLKGMGEVLDPSWPPASLQTQAIAARTYALRAMAAAGELCDDQRCQVYLGAQAEYPAMDQAVDATRDQVVVANGTYAATVYSANGGGFEASRLEGFGAADGASYPYLRAAPYPTQDPFPWQVKVSLADVAARLGYPGQLSGVRVTQRGPSGRAVAVSLDGSTGPSSVSGLTFAAALGLRSTLFGVRTAMADGAPPPPPQTSLLQVSPDQVGGLAPLATAGAAADANAGPGADQPRVALGRHLRLSARHHRGLPWWAVAIAAGLLGAIAVLVALNRTTVLALLSRRSNR